MKYIEAPEYFDSKEKGIFLAGGITGCPDWQSEIVDYLKDTDLTIYNPRRKNFPIHDPNAASAQIKWEHYYLNYANMIQFWFPQETLCPIVLYELGAWSKTNKPIFVGVHPEYKRRQDVEIQTKLARPEVKIVFSLENLAKQIRDFASIGMSFPDYLGSKVDKKERQ